MRRLDAAVGVALLLVACVAPTAADASGFRAPPLRDGLVVPAGTRLIGSIIPESVPTSPPGWVAYLWLDRDAVSAFDALAAQLAGRGMASVGRPPACDRGPAPSGLQPHGIQFPPPSTTAAAPVLTAVSCEGSYSGGGLEALLRVDVCRTCIHPSAIATVGVHETGAQRPEDGQDIAPLPVGTPTDQLTRAEQRQARRAIPAPGERFTKQLDLVTFPGVDAGARARSHQRWRLVAAPATSKVCSSCRGEPMSR